MQVQAFLPAGNPGEGPVPSDRDAAAAWHGAIARRALAAPFDALLRRIVGMLTTQHPGLAQRLERLPSATLLVDPSDLPCRFLIATGEAGLALRVVLPGETVPAGTRLSAPIRVLVALAECRMDADAIFFDRTLAIDGDIEPVLALRNAIESETIDIAGIVLAALGPFAAPARHAGSVARDALRVGVPVLEAARASLLAPVLDRLDALERAVGSLADAARPARTHAKRGS